MFVNEYYMAMNEGSSLINKFSRCTIKHECIKFGQIYEDLLNLSVFTIYLKGAVLMITLRVD